MANLAFLRLAIGLLLLVIANIALGSIGAIIAGTFDAVLFRRGAIKGAVIFLAVLAVYLAGLLNPDLLIIETGGSQVNLQMADYLLVLAAFAAYAVDILKKLRNLLKPPEPEPEPGEAPEGEWEMDADGILQQQLAGDIPEHNAGENLAPERQD